MIETLCQCGFSLYAPETCANTTIVCPQCRRNLTFACAEELADGAGSGDFDAHLLITAGPSRVGETILLGGVAEITLGKLPDRNVVLTGSKVSRHHCTLVRVDFGPSRWQLHDNHSTNGVFVNGSQVESRELRDGDVVQVGEYQLKFTSMFERQIASLGGPVCPSCSKHLAPGAVICTDCGINLQTGRSLLVSKGLEDEEVEESTHKWLDIVSLIVPFGILPVASDALGTKRPLATWWIAAITTVASIAFFITWRVASNDDGEPGPAVQNLMHWSGRMPTETETDELIDEFVGRLEYERIRASFRGDREIAELTDDDLRRLAEEKVHEHTDMLAKVGFQWWQPFTSALLHDPGSFFGFLFHLSGNMLFFFVFGMRVNELVGNTKFAITYPLLALGSAMAVSLIEADHMRHAGVGASGAIMGLAGMYFVLFPVQKVHMAIWLRLWFFYLTWMGCKVFRMRGFWLLLLWIGYNDVLPVVFGWEDGVSHWAHLGGFLVGVALALGLLVSRQISAHGNDILSVVLGRRAWALVGRPATARS
jgi:membrane associated rhomboid family serine protease